MDEFRFLCKDCKKPFSKHSCVNHMHTFHGLDKKEVETWATWKDAKLMKNKSRGAGTSWHDKLTLTTALLQQEYAGEGQGIEQVVEGTGVANKEEPAVEKGSGEGDDEGNEEEGAEVEGDGAKDIEEQEGHTVTQWVKAWVKADPTGKIQMPLEVAYSMPPGGKEVKMHIPATSKAKAKAKAKGKKEEKEEEANEDVMAGQSAEGDQSHKAEAMAKQSPTTPLPVGTDSAMSPAGSALSPVRKSLESIAGALQHFAAQKHKKPKEHKEHKAGSGGRGGLEVAAPKCRLTSAAKAWCMPDEKVEPGKRMQWPLEINSTLDFSKFAEHLSSKKGLEEAATSQNCMKIKYFYGMFDLPEGISEIGFVASLWSSGMADDWHKLPIVSPELKSTRGLVSALHHYVDFLVCECNKFKYEEARRCIELFRSEIVKPKGTKAQKARRNADIELQELDAQKLANFPGQEVFKKACKEAMIHQ